MRKYKQKRNIFRKEQQLARSLAEGTGKLGEPENKHYRRPIGSCLFLDKYKLFILSVQFILQLLFFYTITFFIYLKNVFLKFQ